MKAPYILAEIASAHDGEVSNAVNMALAAERAGADGVKFQVWNLDEINPPDDQLGRWDALRFSPLEWSNIFYAVPLEIDLWCEIYGKGSALIAKRAEYIKCEDASHVHQAPSRVFTKHTDLWRPSHPAETIIGRQDYPTLPQVALQFIDFGCRGYADHTAGYSSSLAVCYQAIRQGATIIEKHIMPDAGTQSKDACSAIKASEFKGWCDELRELCA